ncbi:MAG: 1,6-anhydro-N-acetylmuramyl-L-alanine amidase AmpD [Gammaproteobacteria bacterium]|nr:1,6-anhydro-N-acetylmuramyl-L-alanine amidase AmpD [Gammaproteobacteria bacterium]MYE50714.1 1,6-anhydro-N-acetylmuramyl-L-alanine amidase AmpD [Gammaproteobacteria bacterium]MYF49501.1 1,6-anhydro-N-acetylmuramyl-L-alanine amidase AmpD [Gammaproteobacteria bacterium]
MSIASDHWLTGVRHVVSPNCDDRPDPEDISLIVLHGISLPPGEFGSGLVERLFANQLKVDPTGPMADLVGLRVSSHLLIDRDGLCTQFVPFHRRAWHAGRSAWQRRPGCNDYAIGIELEGTDALPYTEAQYRRLIPVVKTLLATYSGLSPEAIVGHLEVAPERKTDPGPRFDWRHLLLEVI